MRFDLHRSKLGLPACDSKEEAHLLTISIQPGGEPHGIGHNLANKSRYNRIKGSLTGGSSPIYWALCSASAVSRLWQSLRKPVGRSYHGDCYW